MSDESSSSGSDGSRARLARSTGSVALLSERDGSGPLSPRSLTEALPLLAASGLVTRPSLQRNSAAGQRGSVSSRSTPVVSSPLAARPSLLVEASYGTESDGDSFYYAPPQLGAISRYSAASGSRLSGVDGALLTDFTYGEIGGDSPSYDSAFVRPFSAGGRPSSASLYSFATGEDARANMLRHATTAELIWDGTNVEPDDWIHNPVEGEPDTIGRRRWSNRGALNILGMLFVLGGVVALFITWPIITFVVNAPHNEAIWAFNLGGINASGQIPQVLASMQLVDSDTPTSAYTKTGADGETLNLVFSDEFNTPGRTFWPGDDPFWEAVSLNYWATHNYEWLDPDAVVTKNGNLEITITQQPTHGFNFRSGMLQSWNKFCFNDNAYVEVNISMPGNAQCQGFWPAAWTMGNLARAGYGASNEGMWPYSYNSCDVGTQPNQTNTDGTPSLARTSGTHDYGGELSWLPGQRASACTCSGEDHPGPSNNVGRSGPEIDVIEAQVDYHGYGTASQSVQLAPFDPAYAWDNSSAGMSIEDDTKTILNQYKGSITQEAASGVTQYGSTIYEGASFATFAYQYQSGSSSDSKITWYANGQKTWSVNAAAFAPNAGTGVGQRLISVEPMYLILNLGLSPKFQEIHLDCLQFPSTMRIDYVRIYQKGSGNLGCDPSDYPTAKYIENHLEAYSNWNRTSWKQLYPWPKNSRETTC